MVEWTAAVILVVIGIAHSALGEASVIRPLLANRDWRLPGIPRAAADPLLRFAWHLTTIAWWALAAVLVGASIEIAFAVTCLSAAALILALLPSHLAWPLFLSAGLLALWAADAVPEWLLWTALSLGVLVAVVAAAVHLAWAFGVSRGVAHGIPQHPKTGEFVFPPRSAGTFIVAAVLLGYAALVVIFATGGDHSIVRWLLVGVVAVTVLRVFGEGRYVGVLKQVRTTQFAKSDDRYLTPLVGLLALGGWAALVIGA